MSVKICALIAFLCAALVGTIVFRNRENISENWKRKFIRKAKKHGTYVEAFMTKKEDCPAGGCMVTYEYQVGGAKYSKRITYDVGIEYHKKLVVYYALNNPAQGMFEEIKESYSVGFHVFCWSFLTLILAFGGLELILGDPNLLGNDDIGTEFNELKILISNPQILVIAVSVIVLYALEWRWISQRESTRKKKKEEAISAGRTILGKRVKSWYKSNGNYQERKYHAVYEYEINGKKYKRGAHSSSTELPNMMWFYYTNSPNKVFCDYDNGDVVVQLLTPIFFILPIAVVYFGAKLLGVDLKMLKNI